MTCVQKETHTTVMFSPFFLGRHNGSTCRRVKAVGVGGLGGRFRTPDFCVFNNSDNVQLGPTKTPKQKHRNYLQAHPESSSLTAGTMSDEDISSLSQSIFKPLSADGPTAEEDIFWPTFAPKSTKKKCCHTSGVSHLV